MKHLLPKVIFLSLVLLLVANVAFAFNFRSIRIPTFEIPTIEVPTVEIPTFEIPTPEIPVIDVPLTPFRQTGFFKTIAMLKAKIAELEEQIDELEERLAGSQCTEPTTWCGDGTIQQPNEAGTGGPENNGYEQCDTEDIIYEGWGYHCSPDCSIARCSLGQGRPCNVSGVGSGLQWCTGEGLWGECEITPPPVLIEVTPVPSPTNDNTPDYTFNSTREGAIVWDDVCISSTTWALAGDNTVTFNELPNGYYDQCSLRVQDNTTNISLPLFMTPFDVAVTPEYVLQWGSFGDGDGEFNGHFGVATYGDYVYVTDRDNHRVQKFDANGNFILEWGSLGSGIGQFINADNVEVDSAGNVYVSDWDTNHIQKFDSNGNYILMWGSGGAGDGQFSRAYGIAIDSNDNVYVADRRNSRIQKFDSSGGFILKWGSFGTGDGQFDNPTNIGVDSNDNLYTVEGSNHRVQKFDSSGIFITKWGSMGTGDGQFTDPYGIDVDSNNYVYVTDRNNHRVQMFKSDGTYLTQWGSVGSGNGQFAFPADLSVDDADNVYVVDAHNHRVQKFGY